MQTIIRTLKLKDAGAITASDNHCRRLSEVQNADPTRSHLNFEYDGDNSVQYERINSGPDLATRIAKLEQSHQIITPRKDSVKCVEIVVAAPPGLFDQAGTPTTQTTVNGKPYTQPQQGSLFEQWLYANFRFAQRHFTTGGDYSNVVSMQVHLDETSPHVHIHIMPVHNGRYNCKHFLGGAKKMQALQDAYHAAMTRDVPSIAWERGQKKELTGRRHTSVKDWYQKLAQIEKLGLGEQVSQLIENALQNEQKQNQSQRQQAHQIIADIEQQNAQVAPTRGGQRPRF